MIDEQKHNHLKTVMIDLEKVYGERIYLKQLSQLLWFNTEGSLKRAVSQGYFSLKIHCEVGTGERYILVSDLVEYFATQHAKAKSTMLTN